MSAWYVVHTHVRGEAKAELNLRRQGFRVFLPRCQRRRRHARRTEIVARPLFPRYLFVWIDIASSRWRPVLSTIGVAGLVRQGDRPIPVPSGVVEQIEAREIAGGFAEPAPSRRFALGDPVRVVEGAFSDLIGQIIALKDDQRVVVLLDLLGRQVRAQLSAEIVAPA